MTPDHGTILLIAGLVAGSFMIGQIFAAGLAVIFFHFGSSFDSRAKDAVIAGQLPPVVAPAPAQPNPKPAPIPQPTPPPAPPAAPKKFTVTATVFGQAGDGQNEVAYSDVKPGWASRPGVSLPARIHGARPHVQVWGPKGSVVCEIVDIGPWYDGRHGWPEDTYWATGKRPHAEADDRTNGAAIDLTPAAAAAVGIDGKGKVDWAFVDAQIAPNPSQIAPEPPWLTLARAEIGFHELPDNHGIQKYVDLAGYGADGEPWCSIFAGAMLRKAGVDITGANAMARSWTTAPSVTKIDVPRLGCLAVFWRGSKSADTGHVGFYVGEDATHVQVLGGNEDDQVEIKALPKAASTFGLIGYYRPATGEPKVT